MMRRPLLHCLLRLVHATWASANTTNVQAFDRDGPLYGPNAALSPDLRDTLGKAFKLELKINDQPWDPLPAAGLAKAFDQLTCKGR